MSTPRSLTIPDEVRRADADTDRGTFATFVCVPTSTPLPHRNVLLVPGFTGSKEDFAPLLPLLAESGWAAATYDQRGQYQTAAKPDGDFSLTGLASDAVSLSRAVFGDDEEVHLVGHSFGGLVAATAALESTATWASLTLMCSGAVGFGARDDLVTVADSSVQQGLEWLYQAALEAERAGGVPPAPAELADFLHERFVSNSPHALAAFARILMDAPDLAPQLGELARHLDIVVLRGENDDKWPHDVQDRLAEMVGTKVVVVPDSAHSPAVENPEATRDALIRIWLS